MKIDRQEIQTALEVVKPALASKETIEQTTSFTFKGGRVITYNDQLSISHPVESLDLEGAIKAEELYKLLSKIGRQNIQLSESESEIVIKAGKSKAGFTLQKEIKLPLDSITPESEWVDLPQDFSDALDFASAACSTDMSRPVFTCIHVHPDGFLEATDTYKIAKYDLAQKIEDELLIPFSAAKEIVKLNPIQFSKSTGWLHFKNDNSTIISCRTFQDDFPDTSKLFEVNGKTVTFPDGVTEALERVAVFSEREIKLDEQVTVEFSGKQLKLFSNSDYGWAEEKLKSETEEELSFSVAPYLLRDILVKTKSFQVDEKKLMFKGENWQYIAVLKNA